VTAVDTGIAGSVDPNSGGDHNGRRRRLHSHVERLFERRAQIYVNSPFVDLNDQAFLNWNFAHIDPTGAQQGGEATLYTAGDLAPSMALNPYLKVFSANGYYDAVTPFFQTILNFQRIPLVDSHAKNNLTVRNYPSGDMIYLDNESRTAMKADLAQFYQSTRPEHVEKAHLNRSRGVRRFSRTSY